MFSPLCFSYHQPLSHHRDPNNGESKVPVTWPAYTTSGQKYLEINANMNKNYVHEKMRVRFVNWSNIFPSMLSVR